MTLAAGTKLGTYDVTSHIGSGGMGEVYQAHDSKLGRDVAIKVLPEQFARDPERLARFQREAKLLAALNHSNIATIHGLEQSGNTHYLVMELVPGETLRDRIAREGPVPVEEALTIARQIAEALEAAHNNERAIIHRDLKPANVKVTPEGRVKVLDFGLAKAFAADTATEDPSNSPTLSMNPTQQGIIMGTAAYMSPEQARGKAVNKATDIFAFGAVLYELLTGKQAFQGEDMADILATVVKMEPDWSRLPTDTPSSIRTLLRRSLRKDKRQRLQDAATLRIEIEDVLSGAASAVAEAPTPIGRLAFRWRLAWAVAAVLLVVGLALGAFRYFPWAPADTRAIRFSISPPETWGLRAAVIQNAASPAPLAVSPDGQRVAFAATGPDGKNLLWVRSLDSLEAQSLAGTDDAASPFWSPDSRFLGFFADGKLKKIDVTSGAPITLCDAPTGQGAAWSRDGIIVFEALTTNNSALQKVSAAGGTPTPAVMLMEGEIRSQRPFFLPDGRHFLFETEIAAGLNQPIYVGSLDSMERKLVLNSDSSNVVFSQGHLLFLREATLMAQPFDAQRLELTGEAFPIAQQIQRYGIGEGYASFSASENGVLAYQTGEATGAQLTWFDRTGKQIAMLGDSAFQTDVELSPNGNRASVSIVDQGRGTRDIWVYDVARNLRTRFTFDPGEELASAWSPDASRLAFTSSRKGPANLYHKAASGAGAEEVLLEDNAGKVYLNWSPDGRSILYSTVASTQQTGNDLWILPLSGDRKAMPFLQTQFNERSGQFSPDGRWVAYVSTESGRTEIYVAPFPGPGGKWQVSTTGGDSPRWRGDGAELFYLAPDNALMAAAVNGRGSSFEVGVVKPLFQTRIAGGARYQYDTTPDGQRFLIGTLPEEAAEAPITVVVNWMAGLEK